MASRPTRSSSRARCIPRHWWGPVPNARWCCTGRPSFHSAASSKRSSSWFADAGDDADGRARRDRASGHLGVARGDPAHLRHRRFPPQRLLDDVVEQLAVRAHLVEHVGMREQREQRVAEHAERRLAAGREQQPQEPVDLAVGELFAVDLGVHEIGEKVAARVGAPLFDERAQIVDHRLARRVPALGPQRTGVDVLRPLRELARVFERHAGDPADHFDRIARRHALDEVGAAERRDRVEQAVDRGTHERLVPPFELRRAERLRHEVAVLAVLLAVHRRG